MNQLTTTGFPYAHVVRFMIADRELSYYQTDIPADKGCMYINIKTLHALGLYPGRFSYFESALIQSDMHTAKLLRNIMGYE